MKLHFILISLLICFSWLKCVRSWSWSETIDTLEKESNDVKQFANDIKPHINSSCQCVDFTCGCCAFITIEKIGLNNTVCINLTYLPKEVGISFTVSIGNRTVYNETISARSPPPICFGVPYLKEMAELCIKFYDLDASFHKLHGCVQLEARVGHVEVGEYKLGCFDIGKISTNSDPRHSSDNIEVLVI